MIDGSRVDGNIGEALVPTKQRLEDAGWFSRGSATPAHAAITYDRRSFNLNVGRTETLQRLDLLDKDGKLLPGFETDVDEGTGMFMVRYNGAPDERFGQFVEDMIEWGTELGTKQTEALNKPEYYWAAWVGPRVIAEVSGAFSSDLIDRLAIAEKRPREVLIADSIAKVIPELSEDPHKAVSQLEALFVRTLEQEKEVAQQLSETSPEAKEAIERKKVELRILNGVAMGVQNARVQRQELIAQQRALLPPEFS